MTANLVKLDTPPDLVDQVCRALLDAISSGRLAPGERLNQEALAAQLAVSRQPVLQALRLLKKDGFVQDAPGRGVQVAPLDAAWTAQVYEVRGALDALAARRAAERGARLDPQLVVQGRLAAAGGDIQAMIDADLAFHQALYAASGNPLIGSAAGQHWQHLRRVMGAVLQASPQRSALWDEHQAIADAIHARLPDAAAALSARHCEQASRNLAERLGQVLRHSQGDTP